MSIFVMSDKYPQFCAKIKELGYNVIASDTIGAFPVPEQKHVDMQILTINNDIFLLNECTSLKNKFNSKNLIFCKNMAGQTYPENILLNFLFLNNTLYGKMSAIDPNLLEYCIFHNIRMVNVKQGYTRCSALVINENAVITSDTSIEKALKENGADVLKISSGNIALEGYDYGFIGGAGGRLDKNTLIFFGDAEKHPDYNLIIKFCNKYNIKIKIICKEMPLTDIGGIVKVF